MSKQRRSVRQWLRDDLAKMQSPRKTWQQIRRNPGLLLRLVLYLLVGEGLLFVVLALTGRLDAFGEWAVYPAIVAGGLFGPAFYNRRA